jgi:hypothetical protein
MIDIKLRAWHPESQSMTVFDLEKASKDQFIASHVCALLSNTHPEGMDLIMLSTGLTSPCGREIWFGDFYYNAGYGNLHINTMADIVTLMEGLAENDIGDYLGNQYENHELLESE